MKLIRFNTYMCWEVIQIIGYMQRHNRTGTPERVPENSKKVYLDGKSRGTRSSGCTAYTILANISTVFSGRLFGILRSVKLV